MLLSGFNNIHTTRGAMNAALHASQETSPFATQRNTTDQYNNRNVLIFVAAAAVTKLAAAAVLAYIQHHTSATSDK